MKNLKRAYAFAFCVIYKSIDKLKYAFWSDWKTILVICVAESYFVAGPAFLLGALMKKSILLHVPNHSISLFVVALVIFNYMIFIRGDRWKDYIAEFDDLPQAERKKWTIGTWVTLALIIVFLVISVYCYSLVDWQGRNNIPIRKV